MGGRRNARGFTLVEVLIALGILTIVMTILYSTFSASSVTAELVEERADELASLTGALDTIGQEIRGAFEWSPGQKSRITFTTMTSLREDPSPGIQTVSYEFDQDRLTRTVLRTGLDGRPPRTFVLLDGVRDPAFSFFDGRQWRDDWPATGRLPAGVRVSFSYKGRDANTVIPVWSRK